MEYEYFWAAVRAIFWALFIADTARLRGYSSILWFIASLLLTPLIALCFLAALPDQSIEKKREKDMELLEKQLAQRGLLGKDIDLTVPPRHTISNDATIR